MCVTDFKMVDTKTEDPRLRIDRLWIERKIDNTSRTFESDFYCGDEEYREEDMKRYKQWESGELQFYAITACAIVSYPHGHGSRRLEWFTSGGLWGIDSDSDKEYFAEVEAGQLQELKEHLAVFGVDVSDFDTITVDRRNV